MLLFAPYCTCQNIKCTCSCNNNLMEEDEIVKANTLYDYDFGLWSQYHNIMDPINVLSLTLVIGWFQNPKVKIMQRMPTEQSYL